MPREACVYVILLNWNGFQDTIACLESVLASTDVNLRVVVCDNASSDGSLEKIEAWATGKLGVLTPQDSRLQRLLGKIKRPIHYQRLSRAVAEQAVAADPNQLVLIENGGNLGFAAGNNVGLRFALAQPDMEYVWILNNDTMVEPDCLHHMLKRLQAEKDAAVCGSIIHFFDQPQIIQAIGGNRFNHKTGCAAMSEGRFTHEDTSKEISEIEASMDYISGCSMLLPRNFLQTVGLMSEEYFLYYEEIDWFTRAQERYKLCIAEDARLYHREGAAIGSKNWQQSASQLSDFYMFRSRLTFMKKHYQQYIAWCYLSSLLDVAKRLVRGQYRNAWTVLSVLLGKKAFSE